MNNMKLNRIVTAVAGAMVLSFGLSAMADNTVDLVNALVTKGILTEEEGMNLVKGHEVEKDDMAAASKKNVSKGISISDALDSVQLTGDVRARYEYRKADGISEATPNLSASDELDRARYAYHIGFKAQSDDFFTEFRLASNASSRSPNVDLAKSDANGTNSKTTGAVYVDRAYVGWNMAPWVTVIAGRMENPNYTSVLTWDKDITPEGLTEKFKYTAGDAHLFANLSQWLIQGKQEYTVLNGASTDKSTLQEYVFQGGLEYDLSSISSFKIAPMFTTYTGNGTQGGNIYSKFIPGLSTVNNALGNYGANAGTQGVNHLKVIDIPAQFDYMYKDYGMRLWADYAVNTDADKRAADAGAAYNAFSGEDSAYLIGAQIGTSPDLKTWRKQSTYWGDTSGMRKGDWSGRLWWQHIEAFALDPNQIDSDIMNAQVNMEGWATSGIYMLSKNTFATATYAHGSRINKALGTGYSVDTNGVYADNYNLLQMDLTFKF
jgi:polyhydroxyalkanoate synthesis regulator phasin